MESPTPLKTYGTTRTNTRGPPFIVKSQVSPVHILRQAAMKLFTAQGDSLLWQVPHVLRLLPSDLLPCTQQRHLNLKAPTVPYQITGKQVKAASKLNRAT